MEANPAKRGGLVSLERVNGTTNKPDPGKPYVGIAYFCLACALRSPPPASRRGQKRTDVVKHYKDEHGIVLTADDERAALGVRALTSFGKTRLISAATWNLLRPSGAPAACQRSARYRKRAEDDPEEASSEDEGRSDDEGKGASDLNLNGAKGEKRPRYSDDGGDRSNGPQHGAASKTPRDQPHCEPQNDTLDHAFAEEIANNIGEPKEVMAEHTAQIIQLQGQVADLHARVDKIEQWRCSFPSHHQQQGTYFLQQHPGLDFSGAASPPYTLSTSTSTYSISNGDSSPFFFAASEPKDQSHWLQNDSASAAEVANPITNGWMEEEEEPSKENWNNPIGVEECSSMGAPGNLYPQRQQRGERGGPIVHLSSDIGGGDFRPLTSASVYRVGDGRQQQQQGISLLPTFPHGTRLRVAIEWPEADSCTGLELQWADDAGNCQTLQWRSPDADEVIKAVGDALRHTVPIRLCNESDRDCVEELRLVRSSTATPSACAAPPALIWRWRYRIKPARVTPPKSTGGVTKAEGGVYPGSPTPTGGRASPPSQPAEQEESEKEEGETQEAKDRCPQTMAIKEEQASDDQESPRATDGALVAKGQHGGVPTSADNRPLLIARPIEVEPVERFGNRGYNAVRVLAIGVNEYQTHAGLAKLEGAEKDAQEVSGLFRRQGAHVVTLVGRDATEARVRGALLDYRNSAGPRDLLIVYFSGHGRLLVSDPSTGATGAGICLHDYDGRGAGFIRTTHLWDWVCESRSGHKLMIFDCCYPAHGLLQPRGTGRPQRWRSLVRRHAAQVLAAAAPNELAYEMTESGRTSGIFTSHLLRGLSGEAFKGLPSDRVWITLDELAMWVRDQVLRATGQTQNVRHGYVAERASDRGQVIFVRPDAALPMVSEEASSADESDSDSDHRGDDEGTVTVTSQATRETRAPPDPPSQGSSTMPPTLSIPEPIVNPLLGILGAFGALSQKRSTIRNDHQHTVRIKSEKTTADPLGNDNWITTAPNQVETVNRCAADFGVQIMCTQCPERTWTGRLVSGTETSVRALTNW